MAGVLVGGKCVSSQGRDGHMGMILELVLPFKDLCRGKDHSCTRDTLF